MNTVSILLEVWQGWGDAAAMRLFAFFLMMGAALGQSVKVESLTVAGVEYNNATVERIDAVRAVIRHDAGVARVDMAKLPETVQAGLGYDGAAAAGAVADEQKRLQLVQKQKEALAKAVKITGEIETVLADGLIIRSASYADRYDPATGMMYRQLTGHNGPQLFIETETGGKDYVTGGGFSGSVVRNGTYSFQTVLGAKTTVKKYTDAKLVVRRIQEGQN